MVSNTRALAQSGGRSCLWSSVALPLGINGAARHPNTGWNYPKQSPASTLFELNPAVHRTARAGRLPSGGPQTHDVRCVPPRRPTHKSYPQSPPKSFKFGLSPGLVEPLKHGPFVSCRQFAASGECNELRRVAVRRMGWRRTARLSESQKHSQQFSSPLGPARRENRLRFSRPKQAQPKTRPSSPPRISLTAAPLSLRRVSARLGKSCQNVPAHFDDFPPKAWRAALATRGYCSF